MIFTRLFRKRRREHHQPKEVYVVGRVVAGHVDGMQQIVGVAHSLDEAYELCVQHAVKTVYTSYELKVTKWEDKCNVKIYFSSGIMKSHTFNITTQEI